MWTFSSCKSGKHSFHLHGRESKVVRPARENSCWGTRTQGWDLSVQDHDSAVVTSVVKAGWYKARAFAEHIQKRHNLTLFLNKLIQQQYNEQKMSCLDTRERREERDWSTLCNIATYDSCSISVSSRRDASRPALCNLQKASVSFFNPQPWRRSGWMPRPSTERRLNINLFAFTKQLLSVLALQKKPLLCAPHFTCTVKPYICQQVTIDSLKAILNFPARGIKIHQSHRFQEIKGRCYWCYCTINFEYLLC